MTNKLLQAALELVKAQGAWVYLDASLANIAVEAEAAVDLPAGRATPAARMRSWRKRRGAQPLRAWRRALRRHGATACRAKGRGLRRHGAAARVAEGRG